ncbi:MAG: DUF5719 family protein [Nitriliruptoraceae bacterium]
MTVKGIVASVLLMAVVTAIGTIDRFVPPPVPVVDEGVVGDVPVGGRWVCPMVADLPATTARVTVAHGVDEGESDVAVSVMSERTRRQISSAVLAPVATLSEEVGAAAIIDWSGVPAAVYREWWFEGGDLPPGIVSGPCVHGESGRWIVPGLKTSGGAEARLRVSNPFHSDATIAVGFATSEGPAEPLALQNVSIPSQETLEIVVNESLPERDDLAAIITVQAGRVVAEGMQLMRSAIGGIDGASLLQAAPTTAETWTIPWVIDGPDRTSWLWVVNPDQRTAAVEFTFHTPDGGVVADGLDEVLVEPGTMRRIDLRGTFPGGIEVAAVTARVSGAGIAVSGAVEVDAANPSRTGMVVQLGAVAPDTSWIVGGSAGDGRDEQLHLVNPTSVSSTVSVAVRTSLGVRRPAGLQGLTVPAGASIPIDLTAHLNDAEQWTAFITADGSGIVAGRVGGSRDGARRLVAWSGVPSAAWHPDGLVRSAYHAPGLIQRLRTDLGLRAADSFAPADRFAPSQQDDVADPDVASPSGRPPGVPLPVVPGGDGSDSDGEADDDADGDNDGSGGARGGSGTGSG